MSGLRLALVTRRFWPMVGGAEMVMSNLAVEFQRLGARPTIVTARWQPDWPQEVVHREAPVVRLPNPRTRAWGTLRYMHALSRWLRQNAKELDGVLVSMLKHSAYVAVGEFQRQEIPVVVRAEGAGESGDCAWHKQARFGTRIRRRVQQADAFVAPSQAIVREMQEAGFASDRLHFLPNGVPIPERCTPKRREEARLALGDANHDLQCPPDAPVVVFTGRLHRAKGLFELVKAFRTVAEKKRGARLWLIGEGPDREKLYRAIIDAGLHQVVSLPGVFDDIDEVLQAADLFVLPSHEEGMSLSLLEAMAAELPVVASDIPGNRALVEPNRHGVLTPVGNVAALSEAILLLLSDRERASALAAEARRRVSENFSLRRSAEQHLELIERMRVRKRT